MASARRGRSVAGRTPEGGGDRAPPAGASEYSSIGTSARSDGPYRVSVSLYGEGARFRDTARIDRSGDVTPRELPSFLSVSVYYQT